MKTTRNRPTVDKEFLAVSGSMKQYRIDMDRFVKAVEKDITELKKTAAGRKKLERAFGKKFS